MLLKPLPLPRLKHGLPSQPVLRHVDIVSTPGQPHFATPRKSRVMNAFGLTSGIRSSALCLAGTKTVKRLFQLLESFPDFLRTLNFSEGVSSTTPFTGLKRFSCCLKVCKPNTNG